MDSADRLQRPAARPRYVPFSARAQRFPWWKVDHTAYGGPTDAEPFPTANPSIGNWGAWETSGIVDASAAFGLRRVPDRRPSTHAVGAKRAPGPDTFIGTDTVPGDSDFTFKREGGQLLLIRIPGI